MPELTYTTLSATDKLLLARDTLRGLESDHFRAALTPDVLGTDGRLSYLSDQIDAVRSQLPDLEAASAVEIDAAKEAAPTPEA